MIAPDESVAIETTAGAIRLRPERADDGGFLLALFSGPKLVELADLALPAPARDALIRMQFAAQTASYRDAFPNARFDIVEIGDDPVGRLVLDIGADAGCVVDFALMAGRQGRGLGSAILAAVLDRLVPPGLPVRSKVLMHNEPSLRMCRRVGFRVVEDTPPFVQLEWRRG